MHQFKVAVVLAFLAISATAQYGYADDEGVNFHTRDVYERGDDFDLYERDEPEIYAREADPFPYEEISYRQFVRRDPGLLFARADCHGEGHCRGKGEATCMVLPLKGTACSCPVTSCGGRGSNQQCECNGKSGEVINNSDWESDSTVSSKGSKGGSKKRPAPRPASPPAQRQRTQKRSGYMY
ncbi:hypothetical protein MMC13_000539 [Lambiella insularis]|nr:hypothetical protein [Lambiella insularis]